MWEMISAIPLWQCLALIGIALSTAEMFAPGFVLMPIGIGFFVAAAFASFVVSPVSVTFILAASVFLSWLFFVRIFKPKVGLNVYHSNAERLVGQRFLLLERTGAGQVGKIKSSGDVFFAISETGQLIEAGVEVVVVRFEGNRAVVKAFTVAN